MPMQENDALGQVKTTHKQMFEEMWLLQKTLPYLFDEGEKSYESVRNAMIFFSDTIFKHFEWEEKSVFPAALAIGDAEIKYIVRDLQKQHIDALAKFDVMKDLTLKYKFSFPDEETREQFINTAKEMIEIVLENARLEDEKLYPFLENKKSGLTFKIL